MFVFLIFSASQDNLELYSTLAYYSLCIKMYHRRQRGVWNVVIVPFVKLHHFNILLVGIFSIYDNEWLAMDGCWQFHRILSVIWWAGSLSTTDQTTWILFPMSFNFIFICIFYGFLVLWIYVPFISSSGFANALGASLVWIKFQ